jgi:hypothetical protein
MYPELYQKWFKLTLNPAELVLMEILMRTVGLLAKATLGHLANNLPLPRVKGCLSPLQVNSTNKTNTSEGG